MRPIPVAAALDFAVTSLPARSSASNAACAVGA